MPATDAHLNLAKNNQKVLDLLMAHLQEHPDWVSVLCFYKAVHIIEAIYSHVNNHHSTDHLTRNTKMKTDYSDLWKQFAPMFMTSKIARYLESRDPNTHQVIKVCSFSRYKSWSYVSNLVAQNLRKIEEEANRLLGATHF